MLDEWFFDDGIALAMLHLDKTIVLEFLKRLVTMRPQWTPTRCAVQLEALTEKTMAAASSEHYLSAWIYALALLAEVDPGSVQLTDRQVEVAFALAKKVKKNAATAGQEAKPAAAGGHQDAEMKEDEDHDDDDDDGEVAPLDWEPQLEDLPNDLQQVLARHTAGTLTLDARALMEDLPVWANLKAKAETNNHKADASSRYDRTLRSTQQKVLGLQRCYAALHTYVHDEDGKTLGQQFWALLLQLETSLLTARKAASIPGAVPTTEPGLFSKEDLKVVAEGQQINNAGMHGTGVLPRNQVFQSFPPPQRPFPNTLFYHRGNSCLCPTTGKAKSRWKWGKSQTGQKGFKPWKGKSFKGGKAHSGFSKGGYGGRGRSYWPGPSRAPTVGSSKQGQCKRRRTSPGDLVSTETASLPIPPTGRVQPPPRTGCFSPVPGPIPERQAHQAPRECRTSTATSWLGGGSPLPVQKPPSAYKTASPSTQGHNTPTNSPRVVAKTLQDQKLNLLEEINLREKSWRNTPLHQRFLQWWQKNASPQVVTLIREGIIPQWYLPHLLSVQGRQGSNLDQAQKILADYEKSGAVKRVGAEGTRHLLPWFLISKVEPTGDTKWRFISDCREINQHFQVQKFRLDHLQQIYPQLKKGEWAAKIDLKDAYFHLPVNEALRPFLRHKVGDQVWEYQAGPFGLNVMPQLFQGVVKTFEKNGERWGSRYIYIYTYLDDIFDCRPNRKNFEKAPRFGGAGPVGLRVQKKLKKLHTGTLPGGKSFGLCNFQEGKVQLVPQK